MPLWLSLPIAGGFVWLLASMLGKSGAQVRAGAVGRVVRTSVEQRTYFVMSLGGGKYQVQREDAPDVWMILDAATGEVVARSESESFELEILSADLRQFPEQVFEDIEVSDNKGLA
jgi:hypothetical protein